jgi:hypothetical protein
MRFDEPQLLQVTRKCRLGDSQLLRGEPAAQVFLVRDARIRDDPKNLPVPKCFAAIHRKSNYTRFCIFIQLLCSRVNAKRCLSQLMQDSHQCPDMHWILLLE